MAGQSMTFRLVGRDDLSRVLNQAGDNADGMRTAFVRSSNDSNQAIGRLTRDSSGRLRDMQGRFVSTAQAARLLGTTAGDTRRALVFRGADGRLRDIQGRFISASAAARILAGNADDSSAAVRRLGDDTRAAAGAVRQLTNSASRLRDTRGRFVSLGSSAGNSADGIRDAGEAAGESAGMMSKLSPALMGVGAAAALSVLPALSALAPLLSSAVLLSKTGKLAFEGIGDAVALAGEDTKEYNKQLKRMEPAQRGMVKAIVAAKKEFSGIGKEIRKIVLPSFTAALKAAAPAIDTVKSGMKSMAEVFAHFGDVFGKLFASGKFNKALRANFELGAGFFKSFAEPLSAFTQSFLDFGAASGPVLDSLSRGLGDLLSKGLPGFFDGLKTGIDGTSKMFDGLFSMLNKFLPAIGELAGAVADALGPELGKLFDTIGSTGAGAFKTLAGAVGFLRPLFAEVVGAIRIFHVSLQTLGWIAKDVAMVMLQTFWPSFRDAENAQGPLQRLADWLAANRDRVREFAQQVSNFIIDFVSMAITQLPNVIAAFRLLSTGVLLALDGIVSGAAAAFSWVPGLGEKLQKANTDFDAFKQSYLDGLTTAEQKARDFANSVVPRLERNKLKMNIDNWRGQIARAREQLSDKNLPPEKRGNLLQNIRDWEQKVREAKRQGDAVAGRRYEAKLKGNKRHFDGVAAAVRGTTFAAKSMSIRGNDGPLRGTIGRWNGRTVGSVVMNLVTRQKKAGGGPILGFASGGPIAGPGGIPGYPNGGRIQGVGTGTSDSNLIWASRNEFMIQAAAVRKYGMPFFQALNDMRFEAAGTAGRNAAAAWSRSPNAPAKGDVGGVTYNIYPRKSVISARDFHDIQRAEEAKLRVRRPR
jgi:hypothetical protein